jgi:FkbM family methyltransferase
VVFDVGSNKGEFTDVLIDNVEQIHLFEPNEMLLTYTKVKYCDRENVVYNNQALCDIEEGETDFYYFVNENNGLSSIYNNPEWDYLPKKHTKVPVTSIDAYCEANNISTIDFLKVDVEGAETVVLCGASEMIADRRIKYIQIEYSPHYKLTGAKFVDIINFVNKLGYKVYSTEVEGLEMTVENFVEDYRLKNFIIKNMEITEDWNGEFKKNTKGLKFNFALEIGAFEGLTSCYICDNLLKEGGRMIAVDPLKDKYLTTALSKEDKKMNKELASMFKGQEGRFKRNTKGKPIELLQMTSREAFPLLKDYKFDFIYIDGDHRKDEVYNDGFECFKMLKIGGHLLFDDYEWRPETAEGINQFLNDYKGRYKIIEYSYQLLIRKIEE